MGFLASLIAYLAAVSGLALALVLPLCAVLSAPNPEIHQQTAAPQRTTASQRGEPAAAATKATAAAKHPAHARLQMARSNAAQRFDAQPKGAARQVQTASDAPRHRPQRLEGAKRWAYQLAPTFAARYMGYVNDPAADSTRMQ